MNRPLPFSRQLPETRFPLVLMRKRIYILPTKNGLFMGGLLFVMLLGSLNYNNNLGFLLTFLLAAMALVSIFLTYRNAEGLILHGITADPVFAGAPLMLLVHLHAGGRARRQIRIRNRLGHAASTHLASDATARLRLPMPTTTRGPFAPGRLTLESAHPFDLFFAFTHIQPGVSALIWPAPLACDMPKGSEREDEDPSDAAGTRPGTTDFDGLSTYRPGDPPNRISWKAYSRGQGLLVKRFSQGGGLNHHFDFAGFPEDDTETRLSKLCHLVTTADRARVPFSLRLPDQTLSRATHPDLARSCLKALAEFAPLPKPEAP